MLRRKVCVCVCKCECVFEREKSEAERAGERERESERVIDYSPCAPDSVQSSGGERRSCRLFKHPLVSEILSRPRVDMGLAHIYS